MKGQFWSFDIVFAMVIFVSTISILALAWSSVSGQFSVTYQNNVGVMQEQLQTLSSTLLTSGAPYAWSSIVNVTNVSTWNNVSIGLANQSNAGTLSQDKIMTFVAMSNYDYPYTKSLLGVGYDYYITISNGNFRIAMGRNPALYNSTAVQLVNVPVLIGSQSAQMQIELWTNTSFGIT